MESQPQNPEFRINPENFTHDDDVQKTLISHAGASRGLEL